MHHHKGDLVLTDYIHLKYVSWRDKKCGYLISFSTNEMIILDFVLTLGFLDFLRILPVDKKTLKID